MKTGSILAAGMSATAAALLFAPVVHAAPVGDPDNRGDAGLHYTVDATTAGDSHTTNPIPHTSAVWPLRAAVEKSDGPTHDQLVRLSTIFERILDSDYDHDSGLHEKKRWQTASYQRVNKRSDSQNRETKVSALAAVSGSIAYMDGIFNVGPGWRTITMPDGSKCGAGCNEVTWNYMSSTGKTGSAAAAGAWMDAHNTPDAVLYTYSGSAVGAQDARALRPEWQGTIIQLGSPARPNNGATYEEGGRPVLQVGGGNIEYISTKSDEAAVRRWPLGSHTIGYRGRDFSKETPLSENRYGDNVTDRVYADPPLGTVLFGGLFTPKATPEKMLDDGYVGKHRLDETSTERRQVIKSPVDDVTRVTTTTKRETRYLNKKPRLRDEGGASRESWSGSALRSGAVAPGVR